MVTRGKYRNLRSALFAGDRARLAGIVAAGCAALAAAAATAAPVAAAPPPAPVATAGPAATRTLVVRTVHSAGPGSLRAAIMAANARRPGSATRIVFAVRGTIRLARALPAVRRRVAIDATSAPGYHGGGPPVVAIDFRRHPGLVFGRGAGGSRLLGLAVDRAGGAGVTLAARHITLNHDYIGLNLASQPAGNRGAGVLATAASPATGSG